MPTNQEFTGWIVSKEQKKVYDKGEWYGNPFFKLTIIKEKDRQKSTLFVYSNLVSSTIFQTIQESHYIDKRYLFFCEKKKRGFVLHNWQQSQKNKPDEKT